MTSLRCYKYFSNAYYPLFFILFFFPSIASSDTTHIFETPFVVDIASDGPKKVIAALKKGDILLTYNVSHLELIHVGIVYFQRLSRRYQGISDPKFSRYYHAFIYIGNGEFAETSS